MAVRYVEQAIYELLTEFASGRIHILRAPQNQTKPFIVFQRTDGFRRRAIAGPQDIAQVTIQIDVYDDSIYDVKDIAIAIENKLDGFKGTVQYGGNSPQDEVEILSITLGNEFDIIDPEQEKEPYLYRNSAFYTVTYRQD